MQGFRCWKRHFRGTACLFTASVIALLAGCQAPAEKPASTQGPLAKKLAETSRQSQMKMPAEVREIVVRSTGELENSGIVEKAKKTGDLAPGFTLEDSSGQEVGLASLLERGPVILTFYRGHW